MNIINKVKDIFGAGAQHDSFRTLGNRTTGILKGKIPMSHAQALGKTLLLGACGAGKTEALVTMAGDSINQGLGVFYLDVQADTRLFLDIISLAQDAGRVDDLVMLNLSGNTDLTETFNQVEHLSTSDENWIDTLAGIFSGNKIVVVMGSFLEKQPRETNDLLSGLLTSLYLAAEKVRQSDLQDNIQASGRVRSLTIFDGVRGSHADLIGKLTEVMAAVECASVWAEKDISCFLYNNHEMLKILDKYQTKIFMKAEDEKTVWAHQRAMGQQVCGADQQLRMDLLCQKTGEAHVVYQGGSTRVNLLRRSVRKPDDSILSMAAPRMICSIK